MRTASSPESDSSSQLRARGTPAAAEMLIVGASARAAAFSAIRAGFQPTCVDQFADVDLQRVAETVRVKDYPGGLVRQATRLPQHPLMYAGAIENYPEILREVSPGRTLLGNDWETIVAVRDAKRVHDALKQAKVPRLSVRVHSDPPRPDGKWLLKPTHGAGGRGIVVWDKGAVGSPTLQEPHYFQRLAEGEPASAVFLATQDPFSVRYVGLTRQLVGMPELNAPPFAWCGTMGPLAIDVGGEILVRRVGTVVAHRFGLRGLFGCDFILEAPDRPLLTEVNPRYTASVEVLEILCGMNLLQDHCRATGWEPSEPMEQTVLAAPLGATVGKVVLFAPEDAVAPDSAAWVRMTPSGPLPALADIPEPGTRIPKGAPVCTLLAAAASEGECLRYLLRRAADVTRCL